MVLVFKDRLSEAFFINNDILLMFIDMIHFLRLDDYLELGLSAYMTLVFSNALRPFLLFEDALLLLMLGCMSCLSCACDNNL